MKKLFSISNVKNVISLLCAMPVGIVVLGYAIHFSTESIYDDIWLVLSLAVLLMLFLVLRGRITIPLGKLSQTAQAIDEGDLHSELPDLKEVSLKTAVQTFDKLRSRIINAADFIKEIEKGNLEAEYVQLDQNSEDSLKKALLSMREQMKAVALQEQERNWATTGLAKFIEILRSNNEDIQALGDQIISSLVKYLKANQGGLFVVKNELEDTPFLEMIACYAYERKKYQQKRVEVGQGLIGQAYLEKDYIYMKEVPADYVQITSGLGQATPTDLLIMPLIVNEQVYGIIEIASFHEFKDYQIDFLQKLGESIASTLANVQASTNNRVLLEEMQTQAEEMKAQEEEMRQNMEELQATQENQDRLQNELKENERILESKIKELEVAQQETAKVKEIEAQRANEQIEKRNQMMVRAQEKFKQREAELLAQLEQKEEELIALKSKA